jgi:hypothetical protein
MNRLLGMMAVLGLTACAVNMGGPRNIDLSTVALRTAPAAAAEDVAAALLRVSADVALVAARGDSAWFARVAALTGLTVSGPAGAGDLSIGFLAGEPVGDTTLTLSYDGGSFTVHDALYEVADERYLDLMAFRVDDAAAARPAIGALLRYMATDVMNSAAVVMAVAVPTAAVGDSVARMLTPAYYDALRCETGPAPAEDRAEDRAAIRLFYGPEARIFCRAAAAERPEAGDLVRASLVLGRR